MPQVERVKRGYVLLFAHHYDTEAAAPDMQPIGSVLSAAFKLQALRDGQMPVHEDEPFSEAELEWNRVHAPLNSLHLWAISVSGYRMATHCSFRAVCG